MKTAVLIIFLLTGAMLSSAAAQDDPSPKGWADLANAVTKTTPSAMNSLNGRSFVIEVAADEKEGFSVFPEDAFDIQRLDKNKFRVTVVDATKLFEPVAEDLILPRAFGWRIAKTTFPVATLSGVATCTYDVVFSQIGGNELDLRKFNEPPYAITVEFNDNSLVEEHKRADKGLTVKRTASKGGDLKLRLRIQRETPPKIDIGSDWVRLPACVTETPQIAIPKTPSTNIPVTVTPPAETCIKVAVQTITPCSGQCGAFWVSIGARAQNVCSARVKCTEMPWSISDNGTVIGGDNGIWVDLDGGGTFNLNLTLHAPYKPDTYKISHNVGTCAYQ